MNMQSNSSESTCDVQSIEINDKQCHECGNSHANLRFMSPRTKRAGYYCKKCEQDICVSDDIYRRDPKQFWSYYPWNNGEDIKTF